MNALLAAAALTAAAAVSAQTPDSESFTRNCLMCHQSGAVGVPGQFPRLAGRIAAIGSKPQGRAYLVDVLTFGLAGAITVDGEPIIGLMPSFAQLPDAEVAAALSYVQTLGDAKQKVPAPFTAEEVRAQRARAAEAARTAADVMVERQSLQRAKLIP